MHGRVFVDFLRAVVLCVEFVVGYADELEAAAYDGNLAGLEFAKSIYPEAKRRFEIKPLISGDDLVKLGMHPGRQFSDILRAVEDLTLEGKLSSSDQALEYVLQHFVR